MLLPPTVAQGVADGTMTVAFRRWKAQAVKVGSEFKTSAGVVPRIALRESAELDAEDVAAIDARLERLDRASSHGAWTLRTLALIRDNPERRAPDLAVIEGRETAPFKIDVRKLKGLGLTISHPVGYELSPRGIAYLTRKGRT